MVHAGSFLKVGVIGLNHKTADLAIREAVARGASSLSAQKALFFPYPTVLLSTCNRTEIYFSAENLSEAHANILFFLRSVIGGVFEQNLYSYFHNDCFIHLCRVTAGLDSAIMAETEIQRQVKLAYAEGLRHLKLPSCMHYIFQKALKVAKNLRSSFAMQAPSLSSSLYEIGTAFWGSISDRRILFVGYSRINCGIASFFIRKGVKRFHLVTQNPEQVFLEGAIICSRRLLERWNEFDWIISASKAERPLIYGKSDRRHLICDLSVPRNVDPGVEGSSQICLMNIERINEWIEDKHKKQSGDLEQFENYLREQVRRLSSVYYLKLSVAGKAREWDYVSNVLHSSGK